MLIAATVLAILILGIETVLTIIGKQEQINYSVLVDIYKTSITVGGAMLGWRSTGSIIKSLKQEKKE